MKSYFFGTKINFYGKSNKVLTLNLPMQIFNKSTCTIPTSFGDIIVIENPYIPEGEIHFKNESGELVGLIRGIKNAK